MSKWTKEPWGVEVVEGGELTGIDAKIAEEQDCEPFALSSANIISINEYTGGKRYNKETKKHDLPINKIIFEIVYDSRNAGEEQEARANAQRIVSCVNNCAGLNPEAIKQVVEALGHISKLRERADGARGMVDFPYQSALNAAVKVATEALKELKS